MAGKRPEILDCCLLPRDKIEICLARVELALSRANREECYAAIDAAFRTEAPEPITLDSHVAEIGLTYRTAAALEKYGYETVGLLCEASQTHLKTLPNIGPKYVREIVQALKRHGLKLRDASKFNDRV